MAHYWSRTVLLCVVASAFPVSPDAAGRAQIPTRVLTGTVFDSAAGTPLAGAVVQLVRLNQSGSPTWATATLTNEKGRYRIEGVAPGRYLIGFQHEALNAFRVEAPAWRVDLSASTTAGDSNVVDLATPSAAELRAGLCSSNEQAGGLIAGRVADGRTGAPLEGATVTVRWSELAIQDDTLRPRSIERTSRVGEDGTYVICGASTQETLALTVAKAGYFTLRSDDVTIPNAGVLRRDHALAEMARSLGTGRVNGRVTRSDGSPVSSARAAIPSLALEQAVVNGRFSFNKVPSGRWLLEVRALGFARWERLVEVDSKSSDEVAVAMVALPQPLEAARVVAPRAMKDDLVIRGILERNRIAAGTMFLPGNPWLRDALFPADVVRAARGFTYTNPTTISARSTDATSRCVLAGNGLPSVPSLRGKASLGLAEGKTIALYVDGQPFRGGLLALNDFLPMKDILAIETYPDLMSAPFIWRSTGACAVIAVWTKKDR